MRFADVHVFPYSRRPGTTAHYLPDQVEPAEKRRRAVELAAVASQGFAEYRRGLRGRTRSVLWETARPAANGARVWSGLTENYVRATATTDHDLANRITSVRLLELDGKAVWAELADD